MTITLRSGISMDPIKGTGVTISVLNIKYRTQYIRVSQNYKYDWNPLISARNDYKT